MVLQIHYLRSGYVDDFNFEFVNDIVLYHINNRYSQYYDYLVIYGHFHKTKLTFFRWLQKRFIDNITGAKERINSSSSLGNTTKSQMIDRLDKFGKHPYVLTTSYYHLYWTAFRISVQMYLEFYFYFWSYQYFDYLLTFIPRLLSVLYLTHLFYQRISKRV